MGAAEVDDADDAAAHRHRRAMGNAVDRAVQAEVRFLEPVIRHDDDASEIDPARQRNAMLGKVRGVLRGVKLDVQGLFVATIYRHCNSNPPLQKIKRWPDWMEVEHRHSRRAPAFAQADGRNKSTDLHICTAAGAFADPAKSW